MSVSLAIANLLVVPSAYVALGESSLHRRARSLSNLDLAENGGFETFQLFALYPSLHYLKPPLNHQNYLRITSIGYVYFFGGTRLFSTLGSLVQNLDLQTLRPLEPELQAL